MNHNKEEIKKYVHPTIGDSEDFVTGTTITVTDNSGGWLNVRSGASGNFELISGGTKMDTNKWKFNALHERFIEFDDINMELGGDHPIAVVTYGDTERYVVISDWVFEKMKTLELEQPTLPVEKSIAGDGFIVYKIEGNFKAWIDWVKDIKALPWPSNRRNHNTVEVSLPQV